MDGIGMWFQSVGLKDVFLGVLLWSLIGCYVQAILSSERRLYLNYDDKPKKAGNLWTQSRDRSFFSSGRMSASYPDLKNQDFGQSKEIAPEKSANASTLGITPLSFSRCEKPVDKIYG